MDCKVFLRTLIIIWTEYQVGFLAVCGTIVHLYIFGRAEQVVLTLYISGLQSILKTSNISWSNSEYQVGFLAVCGTIVHLPTSRAAEQGVLTLNISGLQGFL